MVSACVDRWKCIIPLAGQGMTAMQYEAPKPRPMVRPAYLNFIPSPAAVSFNFALDSYQPSEPEVVQGY